MALIYSSRGPVVVFAYFLRAVLLLFLLRVLLSSSRGSTIVSVECSGMTPMG